MHNKLALLSEYGANLQDRDKTLVCKVKYLLIVMIIIHKEVLK